MAPPPATPVPRWQPWAQRVAQGFLQPFLLLRRLRQEPVAWRAYLRTVLVQAALTLALGSAYFVYHLPEDRRAAAPATELRSELKSARKAKAEALDALAKAKQARAALPSTAPGALEAALEAAQAKLEAADDRAEAAADKVEEAKDLEAELAGKLEEAAAEASLDWWKTLGLWVSSLVVAQWLVLGVSRDFQDRVARDLSLVAGLQPEDVPPWARVRLDVKWLMRKLRRKVRGALAVAAGVTLLSPLLLLGAVVGLREQASSGVLAVVSAYWWVVFTAARSARAWRFEADLTAPRPLRWLVDQAEAVPFLRWWLPRLATRFARAATASLWAPARAVEQDLATFVGLGLARVVATLPLVRIALRAPVVVAAGQALEASVLVDLRPLVTPSLAALPPGPVAATAALQSAADYAG